MGGSQMRVFIYDTSKMPGHSQFKSVLNLVEHYSNFDFFMVGGNLGFIVVDDDQGNYLPRFKVQIKNKFFTAIFKELDKIEPRELEEIRIGHDKFTITSPNYLGSYYHTLNKFNVSVNYEGDLLTRHVYELCKYYLCTYF